MGAFTSDGHLGNVLGILFEHHIDVVILAYGENHVIICPGYVTYIAYLDFIGSGLQARQREYTESVGDCTIKSAVIIVCYLDCGGFKRLIIIIFH